MSISPRTAREFVSKLSREIIGLDESDVIDRILEAAVYDVSRSMTDHGDQLTLEYIDRASASLGDRLVAARAALEIVSAYNACEAEPVEPVEPEAEPVKTKALSVREVARRLRISKNAVYAMVNEGAIETVKSNGVTKIEETVVNDLTHDENVLLAEEVAPILGCSANTVYELVNSKELEKIPGLGRSVRITMPAVRRYLTR